MAIGCDSVFLAPDSLENEHGAIRYRAVSPNGVSRIQPIRVIRGLRVSELSVSSAAHVTLLVRFALMSSL